MLLPCPRMRERRGYEGSEERLSELNSTVVKRTLNCAPSNPLLLVLPSACLTAKLAPLDPTWDNADAKDKIRLYFHSE